MVALGSAPPCDVVASAYHEAGHVVAAFVGGFALSDSTPISICDPDGGATTPWVLGDLETRAGAHPTARARFCALKPKLIVDFAGGAAEYRKTGNGGAANEGVALDMKMAAGSFMRVVGETSQADRLTWMREADSDARQLVEQQWNAIEAIAQALIASKQLSGTAAYKLYQAGRQPTPPVVAPGGTPAHRSPSIWQRLGGFWRRR